MIHVQLIKSHFIMTAACAGLLFVVSLSRADVHVALTPSNAGTEVATLVPNGDFETHGALPDPFPAGWARGGDMFVYGTTDGAANLYAADGTAVAVGHVDGGAGVDIYTRTVSGLTAGATYVLSAYVWNLGDATHHVNANVDLNDIAGEAQLGISYTDPGAATGIFAYDTFVAPAGGSVLVRAFYDGRVGGNTGWPFQPKGAQWDNIAITPVAQFIQVAVPEPSTLLLLALGGLGLWGWRKNHNR